MTGPALSIDAAGASGASTEVRALLEPRGLLGEACAAAYLSFSDPASCIAASESDGRLTPLIGFLPLATRGTALLRSIAAVDENGPRLVANYRCAFPEDLDRLAAFEPEPDVGIEETAAIGWLLAAASLVLGLEEPDVGAASGPAVHPVGLDTFVVEVDGRYVLDGRRFLRSVMSYRIGGVAKAVLGRSMFESLGHFVSDAIGRLLRGWHAAAIVLAGDLFAGNAVLLESARRGVCHLGPPVVDPHTEVVPTGDLTPPAVLRPRSAPVSLARHRRDSGAGARREER